MLSILVLYICLDVRGLSASKASKHSFISLFSPSDESNRQVAFTAWASHGPSISASDGSTVPFGGLILNEGSAFSTSTGVFTAPYSGTYMFFVHADISGDYRGFSVRKNGAVVVLCHNDGGDHRLACGCTVGLHVGDHVAVAHIGDSGVVDAGRETAFSGFRIH